MDTGQGGGGKRVRGTGVDFAERARDGVAEGGGESDREERAGDSKKGLLPFLSRRSMMKRTSPRADSDDVSEEEEEAEKENRTFNYGVPVRKTGPGLYFDEA